MAPTIKRKTRVYWNPIEMQKVAEQTVALRKQNPALSIIRAVDAAQKMALPPERQKTVNGSKNIEPLEPLIKSIEAEAKQEKEKPAEIQPVESAPIELPEVEHVPEPEAVAEQEVEYREYSTEGLLVHAVAGFLEKVAIETVRRIMANPDIVGTLLRLQDGRVPEITRPLVSVPKHNPEPTSVDRPKVPTVLVCGLKGFQQSAVMNAINGRLNLKFWYAAKPGEGVQVLKEKAKNADRVVMTMDATSHSAAQVVESLGKKITRILGGGTTISTTLDAIAKEYGR